MTETTTTQITWHEVNGNLVTGEVARRQTTGQLVRAVIIPNQNGSGYLIAFRLHTNGCPVAGFRQPVATLNMAKRVARELLAAIGEGDESNLLT